MRRARTRAAAFLGAALSVAAGGGLLRADESRQLPLRLWFFRLPGTELGLDTADMDGDGDQDLVIAHMAAQRGAARAVSVYLQGEQPRFSAEPAWRWRAPADACAFLAGDFDPKPGGEVLFLCPTRLVIGRGRGEQVVLAQVESFFDYPEAGGLPVFDLVWDLDGDGRLEVLVPTKEGYTLFARGPEGALAARSSLDVGVHLRFGPSFETTLLNRFLTATSRLRRMVAVDLNGDGRRDLVAYRDQGLARFLQRPDGTFPRRPDHTQALQVVERSLAEQRGGDEGGGEAFDNVRLALADVDADGLPDLLATRTLGEMGLFESIRTQQLLFRGRRGEGGVVWDEDRPDTVINLKGIASDPQLLDWDGDGRRDLVLSAYRMDMFTNLKRAVFKSLTITSMIFRQGQGERGPFDDEPDFVLDVEVPLDVLQQRGGHKAVSFAADLDGDGVRDRVERNTAGSLTVIPGRVEDGEVGFDEDAAFGLAVGRTEPPWVVDLDGDGADELVLEPFAGSDLEARTVRLVGVPR